MTFMETLRLRFATDNEFNQAVFRVPVVTAGSAYYFWVSGAGFLDPAYTQAGLQAVSVSSVLISICLFLSVYFWPGVKILRRLIALILDFGCCLLLLSFEGDAMLPLFAVLLWVTVGYGIRFGGRYLILTSCISLSCIAVIIFNNSYLHNNLFLSAALVLTLIIGPGYAFALISRLQRANEGAQEANNRKSRFVAQVSHDVRQPIHAISMLAARLGDTNLTGEQTGLVSSIDQSVNSAIKQLQTFLNITTIEAGLMKPRLEPVHLGKLFQELVQQHSDHAAAVRSAIHAFDTNAVVLTDRIYLSTILQNLISNAVKHAPGSDILLGCRRMGEKIAVCIYDRGKGISTEHLPKLTERYFRLPPNGSESHEGTGLGLSIVKQLANALGLSVRILSRVNSGTAIWIEGLEISHADEHQHTEYPQTAMRQLAGLGVALIEDDSMTLDATRDLLCRWGCNVQAFAHPSAGIAHHEIIVSDFEFADGSTLADHQALWKKAKPLIIVSGHPRELVEQAIGRKAIAILEKPLRAGELRSALMAAKLAL
jgi:signal transduction histidine kinase